MVMRIVCPNCGEEPLKGQRHVCKPREANGGGSNVPPAPAARPSSGITAADLGDTFRGGFGGGIQRRSAPQATPGAVCASVASLVSKSPSLWRSSRALVRCGGEDFVAALLAAAVNSGWHKDPKRALLSALSGRVANEAAKTVQEFWRSRYSAPTQRRPPRIQNGYQQLEVEAPQRRPGGVPRSMERVQSHQAPERQAAQSVATPRSASASPPVSAPKKPETPRNKSNPRPNGPRGVPMKPIQALMQRRQNQEQEETERKTKQLQETDERNAAARNAALAELGLPGRPPSGGARSMEAPGSEAMVLSLDTTCRPESGLQQLRMEDGGSAASDEQTQFRSTGQSSAPSTPRSAFFAGRQAACHEEAALVPLERRSSRPTMAPPMPEPAAARPSEGRQGERRSSRPPSAEGPKRSRSPASASRPAPSPRGNSSTPEQGSTPSATERLREHRERMKQRESGGSGGSADAASGRAGRQQGCSAVVAAGQGSWQQRIEARQRETQGMESQELEEKQKVAERSEKRSDAMRRVMERQAQRQQDVMVLEA